MTTLSFDVVVLGAGSSGAAVAWMLGARGRRVALLESRPFATGGARWVNDIPPWMFDRAEVERPSNGEKRCDHVPISLVGGHRRARLDAGLRPMWGVDMRRLTERLRENAVRAGVEAFDQVVLENVERDEGRLTAIRVRAKKALDSEARAQSLVLSARLFVDATGMRQALLRRFPPLSVDCPVPSGAEVCTAHQQVREVAHSDGALAFLAKHHMAPGEVLTFTGRRGGYSTLAVTVEPGLNHVEVLTGVGGGANQGRASQLLRELVTEQPWIGPVVYGGGGRIPIRRPYDRLAAPGLVLVGDSGCQVFPVHASGVGSGLVAARILEESLRGYDDPGSERATWAYQSAFHRERGGVHAAYDAMRRASQRLDGATLDMLLASGLVAKGSTASAMDQRLHAPGPREIVQLARAASREPRASLDLVWSALRMPTIRRAYMGYPSKPSERGLRVWARAAAFVCGHEPDVGRGPAFGDPSDG